MPVITLRQLDFNYDSPYVEVFINLDLLIDCHWRTGLIGRNGQGKTTLMRLISGHLTPGGGQLDVPVRTRYFPTDVAPGLTTRDAIKDAIAPFRAWERTMSSLLEAGDRASLERYGGIQERYSALGGYEIDAAIESEFASMELPIAMLERPFDSLSGGEQTRALVISLFVDKDAYPLIDEPTNHLDIQGRDQLQAYLATKPGFLLVSHDRHFLDGAVDHIVSINKRDVRVNQGNYSSWRRHMDEELLHERRTRRNIEREVKHLTRAASDRRLGANNRERDKYGTRGTDRGFVGRRAARQMKKALTFERRIEASLEKKRELLGNQEKERELKIRTRAAIAGHLLTIQNVSLDFGQRPLFENVSISLSAGDRIALLGPNGSGKTSLFNAISGELQPSAGIIDRPAHVSISRAFQLPRWRQGALRDRLAEDGMDETGFRQLMGVMGVSGEIFERDLDTFSRGQLKKVDLCRSMMADADLLLWDEPLNYVDLDSREQIEQAILEYCPTLMFIEHDRAFVDAVATDIIELPASRRNGA